MLPHLRSPLMSSMMLMGAGPSSGGGFVGPLDDYTTDLLDAFSAEFRLLASHAGGIFNVRESVGSTEEVIGVTAEGRLDTTAFNAHIGAGNGQGVEWINQTGATNFVQTSDATKQGQILLNEVGGGAVLRLDEVNDGYNSIRTLTRPFTIFLVERGQSYTGPARRTLQSGTQVNVLSTSRNVGNSCYIEGTISNQFVLPGTPAVACLVAPVGLGAKYYLNGVDATDTSGNTTGWGTLILGLGNGLSASETAGADVCEILVYGAALDDPTVAAITAILNGLRGIS